MDRMVVIANPAASQFTGGSHREVMSVLSHDHHVEAVWPGSPAASTAEARKAAGDGADIVVAMGGDGMVHHVLQGVAGTDTALGIIPAGTTNVAARWLGLPSKPAKAAKLIVSGGRPSPIGLVRVSLQRGTTTTTHHAIFATGFGLDAAIVAEADKDPYRKYRFGSVHYAKTALGVGLREFPGKKPHVTVKSGDRVAHGVAGVIQFRDIYTYFGKIRLSVAPDQPGPMTAVVIERLPRRRAPSLIGKLFRRRDLGEVEGFETWTEIEHLEINAEPAVAVQADGEYLGLADGGQFDWVPDALRVVTPETD